MIIKHTYLKLTRSNECEHCMLLMYACTLISYRILFILYYYAHYTIVFSVDQLDLIKV